MKDDEVVPDDATVEQRFSCALTQIGSVAKSETADAGTYKYRYVTLTDVLTEVKRVCHDNGLAVSQIPGHLSTDHGDFLTVTTMVVAGDGTSWEFAPIASKVGGDPQKQGSALTYLRRYALTSIFAIPVADDDGRAGVEAVAEDEAARLALAELEQRAGRANHDLHKLDKAGKEAFAEWASGRTARVEDLCVDEKWLEMVESWLDERGKGGV